MVVFPHYVLLFLFTQQQAGVLLVLGEGVPSHTESCVRYYSVLQAVRDEVSPCVSSDNYELSVTSLGTE